MVIVTSNEKVEQFSTQGKHFKEPKTARYPKTLSTPAPLPPLCHHPTHYPSRNLDTTKLHTTPPTGNEQGEPEAAQSPNETQKKKAAEGLY
jgi:hypothetical protein